MKDILSKLSEIAGVEKEETQGKKFLTEDSTPVKTEKEPSRLKDIFETMATKQPIPVVGKEGGTQTTGAGFINVTDTSPAATALAQAVGKLAQDKKLQIVVPTAAQQSGTAKPAAGATGQAPAGATTVKEKWGDMTSFEQFLEKYPNEVENFKETGEITDEMYDDLVSLWHDEIPYGTMKARTGDPFLWIGDRLDSALERHQAKPKKIEEKWDTETKVAPSEKGKYEGKTKAELLKQYNALKAKGPHKKGSSDYGKMRELAFAIRAKSGWGKVKEESDAEKTAKETKKTFPNVKHVTKSGNPDWKKHGLDIPTKEQVEETSKEKAARYADRANASFQNAAVNRSDDRFWDERGKNMRDASGNLKFPFKRSPEEISADDKTIQKRLSGLQKAHKILAKEDQVDEVITKKTSAGEIISDFEKSKDPKFKGKSKEERKKMALGAYYKMHPEKSKKESVEEAASDVRIVHNKMLGGWFVVRGPHQTPLSGKFSSKEEAQNYLKQKQNKTVKEAERPSDQVDMGAGLGAGRSPTTLEGKTKMKKDTKAKTVKEGMNTCEAAYHEGKSHGIGKHSYSCRYDEGSDEHKHYHKGFVEGLDECYGMGVYEAAPAMPAATVGGMADQEMMDEVMMDGEMDEGNAFTAALAKTPKGGKFSVGGKSFTDTSSYDSKLDEYTFESLDNKLNALLNEGKEEVKKPLTEGVSVSMSTGTPGGSDTVNINATDEDAAKVLQLIKQAGLGGFGDKPEASDYGAPEQGKHGGISVVGDHDGMMGMMKKLAGIQAQGGSEDYADEEGAEVSEPKCGCQDAMEEGHACGEGKEMVDEVETTDQREFQVAEDQTEEEETTADEDAEAAEDETKPASGGATNEGSHEDEEEDVTETSHKEEEDVTESQVDLTEWANNAGKKGTDASFEQDIEFMTKVISGGLNKPKSTGQTTVPVIANQTERTVDKQGSVSASVDDFKKLAGIK